MHLLLGQEAAALSGDGPSPLHGEKLANTTTGPNGNDGSEMHLSCDRKVHHSFEDHLALEHILLYSG